MVNGKVVVGGGTAVVASQLPISKIPLSVHLFGLLHSDGKMQSGNGADVGSPDVPNFNVSIYPEQTTHGSLKSFSGVMNVENVSASKTEIGKQENL